MKSLLITASSLFLACCANARSTTNITALKIIGDSLPAIRHITDMKMSGDTLLFVYENESGYGQRYLRRAVVDHINSTLSLSRDIGRRNDGYYMSYMPYPCISTNGSIQVISQDECEIYTTNIDTELVRTNQYLMTEQFSLPFPLSLYVQDVFMRGADQYVFMGREPKGGRQFVLSADLTSQKIDTIRQISISPKMQAWMPNAGEMTYTSKYDRLAFAYKFHPIVEIFDISGNMISTVRIGEDTFNALTLDEADFDEQNILHSVDITSTTDNIYILYWGCGYSDISNTPLSIYKLDWNGNIDAQMQITTHPIYKVAVLDGQTFIGWTGKDFVLIH